MHRLHEIGVSSARVVNPGGMFQKPTIPMQTAEIHGHTLAYREAGEGDTLLLIHGMAGSSRTWRKIMPTLAERFHVIAPDMPGHGNSSADFDDYSPGGMASAIRDLLIMKGIERATVIGQSLGGGVAMQLIYQYPSMAERLVLIGSGGLGRDVAWTLRLLSLPGSEFVTPVIAPPFVMGLGNRVRGWLGGKGVRADAFDEMWSAYETLSRPEFRRTFLKTLRSVVDGGGQAMSAKNRLYLCSQMPVLIIWGDKDPVIPVSHAYDTHAMIPTSRLHIVEGVGHFVHVEAPEATMDLLHEFIGSTEPGNVDVAFEGLLLDPHAGQITSGRGDDDE